MKNNVINMVILGLIIFNTAKAQVINEIVVNPNLGDDNCEFVEIKGPANMALTDLYFVTLEGDVSSNQGIADFVYDLSASNLGTNGLLVITALDTIGLCGGRSYGAPATTVLRDIDLDNGGLENGSITFLIVSSSSPIIEGLDYDVNNDGSLAFPVGTTVVDSLGWTNGSAGDRVYGLVNLPSTIGGTNDMATRFPTNQTPRDSTAWYHGDMLGNTDSLLYDITRVSANFPSTGMLTPGQENAPIINDLYLNEIVVNPNAGDVNCEFVEIKGIANMPMTDLYFAALEGDSTSILGRADFVYDLSASSMGTNGLLIITALDTVAICGNRTYGAPETTVLRDNLLDTGRFENGSTSFLLISSPTPITEGTDYDADNDGTLELPAGASIVDSLGWIDGGVGDVVYGVVSLPSTVGGTNDMATRFPTNQTANDSSAWYHGDMAGLANSTLYDLTQVSMNFPIGGRLTPGTNNAPNDDVFADGFE